MMNNTFLLNISLETSSGNGEDCHLVYENAPTKTFVLGVFDGLGGRSAGFDGLKGGQIASKKASEITRRILDQYYGELTPKVAEEIQSAICRSLKDDADDKMQKSRLSGKLAGKRLCTTISLASITEKSDNSCEIGLTWMGDSRIYFLGAHQGLQQLTFDDLEVEKDAFQMIREDPPMSQYLTADTVADWRINYSTVQIGEKGCILACTDGCFQYLSTPWEFELLLLKTLDESNSLFEWEDTLHQKYEQIKQDDVSLLVYFVGFANFESIKEYYKSRLRHVISLYENHDDKLTDFDNLKRVWDIYRVDYEARLSSSPAILDSEKNNLNAGDTANNSNNLEQNIEEREQFEHEKFSSASSINTAMDCVLSEVQGTPLHSSVTSHVPSLKIVETNVQLSDSGLKSDIVEILIDSGGQEKMQHCHSIESNPIDIPPFTKQRDDLCRLYEKARLHENNSEVPVAISLYQKILTINTQHVNARYSLGKLYFNLGEFQCAVQNFEKMPIIFLNDPKCDVMRIYVESLSKIGKYDKANDLCKSLVQENPSSPEICYLMGDIFHKLYCLEEARDFLNKSKSIYKNRGRSLEQIKKINSDLESIARKIKNNVHHY